MLSSDKLVVENRIAAQCNAFGLTSVSCPLIVAVSKVKRITTKEEAILTIFIFCEEIWFLWMSSLTVNLLLLSNVHKCHVNNFAESLVWKQWHKIESARQTSSKVSWGDQKYGFIIYNVVFMMRFVWCSLSFLLLTVSNAVTMLSWWECAWQGHK